eukprot:2993227-Pleurochrysis_carterae.AAC.2
MSDFCSFMRLKFARSTLSSPLICLPLSFSSNSVRRRIQRGREEHKEHWLLGAQRLMQSHRNMLADLKTKQALENVRADVAVKLDLASSRAGHARAKSRTNYSDAKPRVDTRRQDASNDTPRASTLSTSRTLSPSSSQANSRANSRQSHSGRLPPIRS